MSALHSISGGPSGSPNRRQSTRRRAWARHGERPDAVPLSLILNAMPSLPRPLLSRLVANLIERLDEMDGDPDREDDDHGGGNVEDEGEPDCPESCGVYRIDQRTFAPEGGAWREEQ